VPSSGTMVVKPQTSASSSEIARKVAPSSPPDSGSGTMVVKDGGGAMAIRDEGGVMRPRSSSTKPLLSDGTMLLRNCSTGKQSDVVPAFMRHNDVQPASHRQEAPPATSKPAAALPAFMRSCLGSSTNEPSGVRAPSAAPAMSSLEDASGDGLGPSSAEKRSQQPHDRSRSRYDPTHMGIDTLDRELASLSADLERDIGKVYRKYERIERILRSARDKKMMERDRLGASNLHGVGLGAWQHVGKM